MGSIVNKYRVHEVAKDFGVSTKEITEILTKYAETPKNHMQVLEDRELSLIFEYLTQHNPVSNIAVIFAEGAKPAEKKAEPAQNGQHAKPAAPQQGGSKSAQSAAPAGKAPEKAAEPVVKQPMSRVPQKQVVDTRKATNVNLDKYDEKLQDMADAAAAAASGISRRPRARRNSAITGSAATTTLPATSASRRRPTVSASCVWRSSRRLPSPCRSPTRSPWASWPAA